MLECSEWLANERPPWDAYRLLMSDRLVSLYKCPRVSPVGVSKIWRRMMVKCVLKVVGQEVIEACGTEQLCGRVEAASNGASMRCASCGNIMIRSSTGYSSSLMQ